MKNGEEGGDHVEGGAPEGGVGELKHEQLRAGQTC